MTRKTAGAFALAATLTTAAVGQTARPATLTVHADRPGVAISPTLYGLMTEEINHSYDGGLYAELLRNRTFQDDAGKPDHWSLLPGDGGRLRLVRTDLVNAARPVSLRVELAGDKTSVANDGFWGVPVRPEARYTAAFYAKAADGFAGPVTASLTGADGKTAYATATTDALTGRWARYTLTLTTGGDRPFDADGRFVLSASGRGAVLFSAVSLMPPAAGRPKELRPDLIDLMAKMRPAFVRLPGGNYLEGDKFAGRFDWKAQIGPVDRRPGHMGCWGYRSSDGFGLPQDMAWCDALHAEPILAVFAGYTLNGDHLDAGPLLAPFVDEALQEIEYFTGDANTAWGRRRVADGHADPMPLHYVEVGNEDEFDRSGSYDGRFAQFYDAIKAKYPRLQVIATTPVRSRRPDLVDDHFYRSPLQMAQDIDHYDKADRNGPKIFVGEWASQAGRPTPNLLAALGDSAWLLGLERNSDVVPISCYAPLLANVNPGAWQWNTNLIGYDAARSFGSPSYHAQVMLAQNKGDVSLPADLTAPTDVTPAPPHGGVGVGTWHTAVDYKDFVVTTPDGRRLDVQPHEHVNGGHWSRDAGEWEQTDPLATAMAVTGDLGVTDYTVRVNARKSGGAEGFLVVLRAADDHNFVWWNLGGWNDTRTALEITQDDARTVFGPPSTLTVDADRWYDLRVDVAGRHLKCYVDGKLVQEADVPPTDGPRVFAGASYDKAGHAVLVKLVNMTADPLDVTLKLDGVGDLASAGTATVLTGPAMDAVNTVETPQAVVPRQESLATVTDGMHYRAAARSLTILRLGGRVDATK